MRRETSWLRDSACCWPAVLMLVTMAVLCQAAPALAEKTVNAANVVCSSSGQETHPGLFAELNSNILKPDGWRVANPHANVSGYSWRTDLAKLTDAQLAAFQVLRFSATSPVILSPGDSDRLRAWVSAGGTLWIDDAGGMLIANFFEPFDFRGYDGQAADGNKRAATWQHDLFTSVFQLTAEELSRLGHQAYSGHIAGFDQQAWVVAAVNGSDAFPDILVRRLGQGRIVVTADNVGGAVADNRNPEDVKFCYNLLNWLNDQTPPNTQVTNGPGPGSTLCTAGSTISWTGSDDTTAAGHLFFSWRLDGGAWSVWDKATTTTLSGLAPGTHTFEVA